MFSNFKIKKLELELAEAKDTIVWKNSMLTLYAEEIERLQKEVSKSVETTDTSKKNYANSICLL